MTRIYVGDAEIALRTVYSESQIAAAVESLAARISTDYAGKDILLIVVLQGAFIFAADLARRVTVPVSFDFVRVASYEGMESNEQPALLIDATTSLKGKHVVVVEDIVDTGISLSFLLRSLRDREPASIRTCALVDKRERRKVELDVDYAGLICEKGFLVGYGLDLDGELRQLPGIYHVERVERRRTQ